MFKVEPEFLLKLSRPVPRYTSYPTSPEWRSISSNEYEHRLLKLKEKKSALSLYIHIPFCRSMCLYCGCSVVLNRRVENEERYVDYLIREIRLAYSLIGKKKVHQLHFGGGTPTKLSIPLFTKLFTEIKECFEIDFTKEIAIEIDPRTVYEDQGAKLCCLKELGFNRVSFGVQDTDPKVQQAVKRHQSYEMTKWTYEAARKIGFEGINIDLIYGLPYQTVESFRDTVEKMIGLAPDRISLFSYAKVPWLKPHQKAIKEETLPDTDQKFSIYSMARQKFMQSGYVAIGMDHFAKANDEIAKAYLNKTLGRNFQGYTVRYSEDMLGFGATAIGFVDSCYFQNCKELEAYYQAVDQNQLPVERGHSLSKEDSLRKWVIHKLMCDFRLDKREFEKLYGKNFDAHFPDAASRLEDHVKDGLVVVTDHAIHVTPLGELFVRLIASSFDAYLHEKKTSPKFSNAI